MFNNLKDLLIKSINQTWKQEQVIKSIIWNSVISDFKEIKKLDITPYLISIKILNDTIIIKTTKPILNSELSSLQDILEKNAHKKLNDLWFKYKNLKIRYK